MGRSTDQFATLGLVTYNCFLLSESPPFEWVPHGAEAQAYRKLAEVCCAQSVEDLVPEQAFAALATRVLSGVPAGPAARAEMQGAMAQAYELVRSKTLLQQHHQAGFMDAKDENGLGLNMSGLEMVFKNAKLAPQYLGVGRIGSTTRASAVEAWEGWWQDYVAMHGGYQLGSLGNHQEAASELLELLRSDSELNPDTDGAAPEEGSAQLNWTKLVAAALAGALSPAPKNGGSAELRDQRLCMRRTQFWGMDPSVEYPWLRTLAHYLLWQRLHLELAFSNAAEYDAGAVDSTAWSPEDQVRYHCAVIEAQVREHGADVVCLQECTRRLAETLETALGADFVLFPAKEEGGAFSAILARASLAPRRVALTAEKLPAAKIVAVELTGGPCGTRTVACFHAPSGGGEKIVDFLQRLAAELPSDTVMAGDTNVCPSMPGKPRKSALTYAEVFEKVRETVAPRTSVCEGASSCFGASANHANTTNKCRWIGSAQLPKVGKEDTNPKDHIFLPPSLMLSEAPRFFPAEAAEYQGVKYPSDHLGVSCLVIPVAE